VYPGNFDTPQRANALLFGLCQEAAEEIKNLRGKIETLYAMYEVVTKQRDYLMDQERSQVAAMRGRIQ
jgi:archaellum component FlaC